MARGGRTAADSVGQEGGNQGNTWSRKCLIGAETTVAVVEICDHVLDETLVGASSEPYGIGGRSCGGALIVEIEDVVVNGIDQELRWFAWACPCIW